MPHRQTTWKETMQDPTWYKALGKFIKKGYSQEEINKQHAAWESRNQSVPEQPESNSLFKELMDWYITTKSRNEAELQSKYPLMSTPEFQNAMGLTGMPMIAGRITPSVFKILAASGRRGLTQATPKLGSELEKALMETNPSATSYRSRIPHWGNVKTQLIRKGELGGTHPPEFEGAPNLFRIHEMPDYVSIDPFSGMTPEQIPEMIRLVQSLQKPIVVPEFPEFGKYAGGLF